MVLQTAFIGAAGCAIWLLVAPRLGEGLAVAAVVLAMFWLAWRAALASQQRPSALLAQGAGQLLVLDGTRQPRVRQLLGVVQWPGMLALQLMPTAGGTEALLVMSDALAPDQYCALAAWARRQQRCAPT